MSRDLPVGDVPAHWETVHLAKACSKIGSGATPRGGKRIYQESGTNFIRSQNVLDHHFRHDGLVKLDDEAAAKLRGVTVEADDVLLNITGDSIARCCLAPADIIPARVNQHVAIIRPRAGLHPLFLQKYLTDPHVRNFILSHDAGGTRKAITKGHIESFLVPRPPVDEQHRIVAVFQDIDAKIELNQRVAGTLDRLAADIVQAALRDAPTVALGDLAAPFRKVVNPRDLQDDRVDYFSIPAYDEAAVPEDVAPSIIKSQKLLVEADAVLVSRINPRIRRTWLAYVRDRTGLSSTEFLVLRPRDGGSTEALWAVCASDVFTRELEARVTGTSGSHQRVRADDALSIGVPDIRQLDVAVAREAHLLLRRAHAARRQTVMLSQVRAEVIPSLVAGHLVPVSP